MQDVPAIKESQAYIEHLVQQEVGQLSWAAQLGAAVVALAFLPFLHSCPFSKAVCGSHVAAAGGVAGAEGQALPIILGQPRTPKAGPGPGGCNLPPYTVRHPCVKDAHSHMQVAAGIPSDRVLVGGFSQVGRSAGARWGFGLAG